MITVSVPVWFLKNENGCFSFGFGSKKMSVLVWFLKNKNGCFSFGFGS